MDCPKCSGTLAFGKERDFYNQLPFLKCFNCGKTVYLRVVKLPSAQDSVVLENIKYS